MATHTAQAIIARLAAIDAHLAEFPPDGSMPKTEGLIVAERERLAALLGQLPSTIKEINGRFTCTACGYEWSAMCSEDEIPERCSCESPQ